MDENLTRNFMNQLKNALNATRKTNSLSLEQKELLENYLPELEKILEDIMSNIHHIASNVQPNKKQYDEIRIQKDVAMSKINDLDQMLQSLNKQINELATEDYEYTNSLEQVQDQLCSMENTLREKKKESEMQMSLPFFIGINSQSYYDLKNKVIPELEKELNELNNKISSMKSEHQTFINKYDHYDSLCQRKEESEREFLFLKQDVENIDNQIATIFNPITTSINELTYLYILKACIDSCIEKNIVIDNVMKMLEKSPGIIDYGESDVYFEIFYKLATTHDKNTLNDYITTLNGKCFFILW